MMRFSKNALILALTVVTHFATIDAQAANDCYDEFPVVDLQEEWDFSALPRADFYLPSLKTNGPILTAAAAHLHWEDSRLHVFFDHVLPKHIVGNAYTVHRFQIQIGADNDPNKFFLDNDLTKGCTDTGQSFFPRESVTITPIKVPAIKNPLQPVRIRIWGHL